MVLKFHLDLNETLRLCERQLCEYFSLMRVMILKSQTMGFECIKTIGSIVTNFEKVICVSGSIKAIVFPHEAWDLSWEMTQISAM